MNGIKQPSDVTLEYCARLIEEYTALDCAQMYSILKHYGKIPDGKRKQMMRYLCQAQYAQKITQDERTYFIRRRRIEVKDRLWEQIMCFWVLLGYLHRVDRHCVTGTASSHITMEIEGRDYSILYVQPGKEKMCSYSMDNGGVTRYFVVVEDPAQIPLIKGDQIHAFVTIDERRQTRFYASTKGD